MKKFTHTCDCCDPGCPVHKDKSGCTNQATVTVRRLDFEDQPIYWFCDGCAQDALDSGVFV
jgi:hypothetical protein